VEPLKLPNNLFGRGDIMNLSRELNSLNDFFIGAAARQAGTPMQAPKTTRLMEQLAELNKLNLLDEPTRKKLGDELDRLIQQAPNIHISFASEPSPKTLEPVLVWLRANIHPQIMLQVGLQPSIAAGCTVRTANKIFDFSLRSYLEKQSQYLAALVSGAVDGR